MRSAKKLLNRALESALHLRIYSTRPHGRDDCVDLRNSGATFGTIFDVGANDGGSALKFHEAFPTAVIHSFEPVSRTFDELSRAVRGIEQVRCHRLAMGDAAGEATIYLTDHSATSSLLAPEHALGSEIVPVTTVDRFAAEHGIGSIDLLKVDAEGYDLQVLHGAASMLDRGAIGFVLSEIGWHRGDSRHVLFDEMRDLLAPKGFSVYGIYDQQLEWSGENRLRYANVCFAHASMLDARSRHGSTA